MTDESEHDGESSSSSSSNITTASTTSCDETCSFVEEKTTKKKTAYIATWADVAPTLQAYVDAYHNSTDNNYIDTEIRLAVFPSIHDLVVEVTLDVQTSDMVAGSDSATAEIMSRNKLHMYDGFVVPPILSGELYQSQGVIRLDDIVESNQESWDDMLPHYRKALSSIDGETDIVRFIPLFAGNQLLMFYRQDWLTALGLDPPQTWDEFIQVANELHMQPLGSNGESIVGSCLGRLSQDACRMSMDSREGFSCRSMSMSYTSMVMSSINQIDGSSTGWLFDNDDDRQNDNGYLKSLLEPALDKTLQFMEEQLQVGDLNQLQQDSIQTLDRFREGNCALTISAEHPKSLLMDDNIGIAPLPGSYPVLDRSLKMLANCTEERCPYGVPDESMEYANLSPFGAIDAVVGGVSSFATEHNQDVLKDFLQFMLRNPSLENAPVFREQALTYSQLAEVYNPRYWSLLTNMTKQGNIAYPLRTPKAFELLTTLDSKVYEYLESNQFSKLGREETRRRIEQRWQITMEDHNAGFEAVPLSIFYEKSLGTFVPEAASHLYIGDYYRALGWLAGLVVIGTSCIMAFWVWWYKKERVVSTSQPLFLWMLCAGTVISAFSIFLFGVEDDIATYDGADAACMASVWLYSLGFVTTFTALFAKTWRINQIFRVAHEYQRIKVEPLDVVLPFLIVFGCNVIILVVWNILHPLRWERLPLGGVSYDDGLRLAESDTYGSCEGDHKMGYFWVLFGFNSVYASLALIQTYECRKVTTEYNECIWITVAATCSVQAWIFGLPVMRLTDDNPRARFFVKTGVVFATCMSTLLFIFLPKIGYLKESLKLAEMKKLEEGEHSLVGKQLELSHSKEDSKAQKQGAPLHPPSEDSAGEVVRMGAIRFADLPPSNKAASPMRRSANSQQGSSVSSETDPVTFEGLRIIRSASRRFSEIQRMQKSVGVADEKNRVLQDRLERLQQQVAQQKFQNSLARTHMELEQNSDLPRVIDTSMDFSVESEFRPKNLSFGSK